MKTKTRLILKNHMWHKIMPHLPSEKGRCARPSKSNRLMVEAMLWRLRSGAPWRDLPPNFGPWESVYTRFSRWSKAGIFQKVFELLKDDLQQEDLLLDSTIVRAHQHAHGAEKKTVNKK
jgi:transposase